jgi:hypothetical protein
MRQRCQRMSLSTMVLKKGAFLCSVDAVHMPQVGDRIRGCNAASCALPAHVHQNREPEQAS